MSLGDYLMDDYDSRNGDDGNDMHAGTDTSDPDFYSDRGTNDEEEPYQPRGNTG
jgi:hypothetical protein